MFTNWFLCGQRPICILFFSPLFSLKPPLSILTDLQQQNTSNIALWNSLSLSQLERYFKVCGILFFSNAEGMVSSVVFCVLLGFEGLCVERFTS